MGILKEIFMALILGSALCSAYGDFDIIKDGKGQADIVISDKANRVVELAASELQENLFKISGVKLPIATVPGNDVKNHIYVGKSAKTESLKITDEGLKYGAFKMVSGPDWLVLLGEDKEFTMKGPEIKEREDAAQVIAEWDKITGEKWEYPYRQLWKGYNGALKINEKDETGSINAVYGFLYMQGMRWYSPDPLGEIVPEKKTVSVPEINKTVTPDFPLRHFYQYGKRYKQTSKEEVLWQLRLGLTQAPEAVGLGYIAHGTGMIISRDEVKNEHPEYYALIGGVRQNKSKPNWKPCFSSEELFQQNVKFIRYVFDTFDAPMVSVMPTDGFTAICQCEKCKDKARPECGWNGQFSDYVWDYVNRVAAEVYKTHPNKKIVGMAYTTYLLPPEKIKKFSPNLVVCIAQWRVLFNKPEERKKFEDIRKGYLEKMTSADKVLCTYDYYRYSLPGKGRFLPAFMPHIIADDLRSLKGISLGDYIEINREREGAKEDCMAVTHLNSYVTARLLWDADQDVNKLLEEYYTLFYGPARDEMKAFIEYSEANWSDMKNDGERIGKLFELMEKALKKAPADSVYAKRIALINDYIKPLKALQEQLQIGRDKDSIPKLKTRQKLDIKLFTMDGKLDDAYWKGVPTYASGVLKDAKTGNEVSKKLQTSFKLGWADDALYIGIKCMDPDMKKLNIGTSKNDDGAIWKGDCIEILIETQENSYYQIVVSPDGAIMDIDRNGGKKNSLWSSDAQALTFKGDDFWSAEIRIPIADQKQANLDGLNGLSGRKPDWTYPWYINICRQRVRNDQIEQWAFAPSEKGFHDIMKFAMLTSGKEPGVQRKTAEKADDNNDTQNNEMENNTNE